MPISLYLVFACLILAHGSDSLAVPPQRILVAIAMVTISPIILAILQGCELRRMPDNSSAALRRRTLLQFERIHLAAWSIASLAGVWIMNWPTLVRLFCIEHRLEWASGFGQVLPAMLSLVGSWVTQIGWIAKIEPTAEDGEIARPGNVFVALTRTCRLFLLVILPLWVLCLVERSVVGKAISGVSILWIMLSAVGLVIVLLPAYLRFALRSEPITIPTLGDEARRWPIRQWHTGYSIHNAMLAGFLPGLRTIYVSDGLVRHFSDTELAAIVRHEIAHAQRHHAMIRLFALLFPIVLGMLAWQLAENHIGLFSLLLGLATTLYVFVVVRRILHWIEFDADRISVIHPALGRSICPERQRDLVSALGKLARLFPDLNGRSTYFHPSLRDRLARLLPASNFDSDAERAHFEIGTKPVST